VVIPDAIAVPRRAVMSSAQGSFVWLVGDGDTVELRLVRLAGTVGDRSVIAEGLAGGERVVVEGVLKVQPGAKVKIAAADEPNAPAASDAPAASSEPSAPHVPAEGGVSQ
jgi:membrane fusion protein (multidrug efflux system)